MGATLSQAEERDRLVGSPERPCPDHQLESLRTGPGEEVALSVQAMSGSGDEDGFERLLLPLMSSLLCDELQELIFADTVELVWMVRTGQLTMDELYSVQPLSTISSRATKRCASLAFGSAATPAAPASRSRPLPPTVFGNMPINCDICGEPVAGCRYASHLERCMNGGKRGPRKHYDALREPVKPSRSTIASSNGPSVASSKRVTVDPYPNSPIVRIQLKSGVIVTPLRRLGATLEEFDAVRTAMTSSC